MPKQPKSEGALNAGQRKESPQVSAWRSLHAVIVESRRNQCGFRLAMNASASLFAKKIRMATAIVPTTPAA